MRRLRGGSADHQDTLNAVVILGSGPKASQAAEWDARLWHQLVVINNAWRIRADWDACVFPEDFPDENRPVDLASGQTLIQAEHFVPQQNRFDGVVCVGGTMAFTSAYWAPGALKPDMMAFLDVTLSIPNQDRLIFTGQGHRIR